METKKVLVLTYYWPPSGGSGVQRWVYFTKYLSLFGITPTVITVDERLASYPSEDNSLLEEIKSIRSFKTKTFEPLGLYSLLKSGNRKKIIPQGNVGGNKKSVFDKVATYIRANYFIPDARVGWNFFAYRKAVELIKKEHFDLIITTGPPHSTHLVGQKLKKEFGIKWLADFRDPWTEVYYNNLFKRTKRNSIRDKEMESSVLNSADVILTVGPSMLELLNQKIKSSTQNSFYIYNGYDELKFENLKKENNETFTIRYTGTLTKNYPYLSFIQALNKIDKGISFTIEFIGNIEESVQSDIKKESIHPITFIKNISHNEIVKVMKNSDLLLLFLPYTEFSKIMLTGKLFEYIATQNPILCIGDKITDAAKIVDDIENSIVCEPNEIEKINSFISQTLQNRHNLSSSIDPKIYGRKYNTQKLAEIIHKSI